jgi:hypothetical protein
MESAQVSLRPKSSRNQFRKSYSEQDNSEIQYDNKTPTSNSNSNRISQFYQVSPRQVENINEIRRLVREQSSIVISNSIGDLDGENLDAPLKKFTTPLPDIPRSDDAYYRTESRLIKDCIEPEPKLIQTSDNNNNKSLKNTDINLKNSINNEIFSDEPCLFTDMPIKFIRKETRYHFGNVSGGGGMSKNQINFSHRLPALDNNKQNHHNINNTMDLDEDLPINPINPTPDYINQRLIYTSPGDRIISPIKRPQAPSPMSSAYRRKSNKNFNINSESDSETDLIITQVN